MPSSTSLVTVMFLLPSDLPTLLLELLRGFGSGGFVLFCFWCFFLDFPPPCQFTINSCCRLCVSLSVFSTSHGGGSFHNFCFGF